MKKKWFTLIEMLIVIVIIGILLTLSMRISWDRIQILKTKSVWEQVVYNYNNLYAKNLLTNYYEWDMYDNMVIRFVGWDTKLYYYYKTESDVVKSSADNNPRLSEIVQWWKYEVEKIYFDWNKNTNESYVVFEPYKIWCKLLDQDPKVSDSKTYTTFSKTYTTLNIDLLVNGNNKYCFKISKDLCKLEVTDCK